MIGSEDIAKVMWGVEKWLVFATGLSRMSAFLLKGSLETLVAGVCHKSCQCACLFL